MNKQVRLAAARETWFAEGRRVGVEAGRAEGYQEGTNARARTEADRDRETRRQMLSSLGQLMSSIAHALESVFDNDKEA